MHPRIPSLHLRHQTGHERCLGSSWICVLWSANAGVEALLQSLLKCLSRLLHLGSLYLLKPPPLLAQRGLLAWLLAIPLPHLPVNLSKITGVQVIQPTLLSSHRAV